MRQFLLFIVVSLFLISCEVEMETTKPSIQAISESVYASVTIVPQDVYNAYSVIPGLLDRVYVKEGDLVKKGQALAQISTSNQRISRESAKLNMDFAKNNNRDQAAILSGITDEIRSVKDQLKLDSLNYYRQKSLWENNVGSKNELENKALKYELIQTNLEGLKKKYERTKLELDNKYRQSKFTLQQVESSLKDYTIKAKMDGRIYALRKEEKELISTQESLAQIGRANDFIIEMLIDEVDIVKVGLGQLIYITLDAYKGQVFEAEIIKIFPLKDSRSQTFKVEGQFIEPPVKLFAGLSGEANIVLEEKENAITIPLSYLKEGEIVQTKEGGEVKVKTGLQNINYVEIVSGIDTSTILMKPEVQ